MLTNKTLRRWQGWLKWAQMEKPSNLMPGPRSEYRATLNIYQVRDKKSLVFPTLSKIYNAQLFSNNVTILYWEENVHLFDKSGLIAESYRASVIWSKLDRANTQISIGDTIVPEVSPPLSTLSACKLSIQIKFPFENIPVGRRWGPRGQGQE